jgi:hypothetical protein
MNVSNFDGCLPCHACQQQKQLDVLAEVTRAADRRAHERADQQSDFHKHRHLEER